MNRQTALVVLAGIVSCGLTIAEMAAYVDTDGNHVSAELSPFAALAWPFVLFIVVASWRVPVDVEAPGEAKWYRVLGALYVDIGLYAIVALVPLCLLALVLEGSATSSFAWSFSRDFSRPTDVLLDVVSIFVGIFSWSAVGISMWASRRTPGGLLMGIALVPDPPVSFWRCACLGFPKYMCLAFPLFAPRWPNFLDVRAAVSEVE